MTTNTARTLDSLYEDLVFRSQTFLGYPCNNLPGASQYGRFLDFTINNVGDPFSSSNYGLNSHAIERDLVDWFSQLHHLDPAERWGYVTSGGTEGNYFGLYLGRESYPDAVLLFSRESHYSVAKGARLLRIPHEILPTNESGQLDLGIFADSLCRHRGKSVIVSLNLGTTMKGAIDDVAGVVRALEQAGIERYYLHGDAALFGVMVPFADPEGWPDFRLPIQSLAISGHKFLGCPVPCGMVLARQTAARAVQKTVEYIGALDSTLSGSRNGFAAIVLWDRIFKTGAEGFIRQVAHCQEVTQYAVRKLSTLGWPAFVNPNSNIVVIRRPDEALTRKWALASEGDLSHLVIMPHVTRAMVDAFLEDLVPR